MSQGGFQLQSWLDRIGYDGPRVPSMAALRELVMSHCTTVPYENVDVVLGQPPRLDLGALQQKILHDRRGGYCFEQNMLVLAGLRAFGFAASPMVGRVIRGFPPDALRMAGHMAIRVALPDGDYLADVGFGNLTPTAPLRLCADTVQNTPHGEMRFVRALGELVLQTKLGETWENMYRLCAHDPLDIDFEYANWYIATHPDSLFVSNLIAARPERDGTRHTFLNGRVTTRHADGRVATRVLDQPDAIAAALADPFRLVLSDEMVRAAVAVIARKGTLAAEHRFFA